MFVKKIVLVGIFIIAIGLFAAGIKVRPGTLVLHEAPIGETYDFQTARGQSIVIGPVQKKRVYSLLSEPASLGGSQATGYFDFPNPDWFELEFDVVSIEAGTDESIAMWMTIPGEEGYYNHHWLVGIPITPVTDSFSSEQIQVGAYLLFRIETAVSYTHLTLPTN